MHGPTRLQWPDIAKGLCALLVVLNHVRSKYLDELGVAAVVELGWGVVSAATEPVRMPGLFVVSGYFAARAMSRPWRSSAVRLATNYWIYVVWLLIGMAFYTWERELPTNRTQGPDELLTDLLWAATNLWFLWAIVAYYVIVRATMWVPAPLLIGLTATWTWFVSDLGVEAYNRESTLLYLGCFVVGARAPQVIAAITRRRIPVAVTLVGFGSASALLALLPLARSQETLLGALFGVPALLLIAVRLDGTRTGTWVARRLGERTLPIYVLHLMLLALLLHVPALGWSGMTVLGAVVPTAVAALLPVLVTAVLVAGSLVVHRVLMGLGGGLLFSLPAPLERALRPAPSPGAGPVPVLISGTTHGAAPGEPVARVPDVTGLTFQRVG